MSFSFNVFVFEDKCICLWCPMYLLSLFNQFVFFISIQIYLTGLNSMCWRKPYWQTQEHVWHTSYHIFFVKTNHILLWIYGGFLFVLVRSFWNFFYNHNEFSSILQIASLYGLWEDFFVGIDDSKELDISDRVKIVQSKSCLINSSSIFFFLFLIKTFNFRWRMGNVASHFLFLPLKCFHIFSILFLFT